MATRQRSPKPVRGSELDCLFPRHRASVRTPDILTLIFWTGQRIAYTSNLLSIPIQAVSIAQRRGHCSKADSFKYTTQYGHYGRCPRGRTLISLFHIDPTSKQVSVTSSDKAVQEAIAAVNVLHSAFKSLETQNNIPPPPVPVNPKRSAQIQKLRDSAAQSARKGNHTDAIRLLGVCDRHGYLPTRLGAEWPCSRRAGFLLFSESGRALGDAELGRGMERCRVQHGNVDEVLRQHHRASVSQVTPNLSSLEESA